MTNKGWSYVLLTVIFLSFTAGCQEKEITIWPESKLEEKPNIVWLVCEDQSSKFFPMYGDKTIDMPILNSLADNAVIYENAFTPAPVCAPARSSIITGMYQTTLGTHNMRTYNRNKEENQPTIGVPIYSPVVPENVKVFTN